MFLERMKDLESGGEDERDKVSQLHQKLSLNILKDVTTMSGLLMNWLRSLEKWMQRAKPPV